MLRFVLRRLALMVPVLVGLSILLFAWLRALPGDPARSMLGQRATPEGIARINAEYGFNEPILTQYFTYMKALLSGDFGQSIKTGEPVTSAFIDKFPATMELGVTALLLAVVVGVPLGYLAARLYDPEQGAVRVDGVRLADDRCDFLVGWARREDAWIVDALCNAFVPDRLPTWERAVEGAGLSVKVGERPGVGQVVDRHEVDVSAAQRRPHDVAADSAEAVDTHANGHGTVS